MGWDRKGRRPVWESVKIRASPGLQSGEAGCQTRENAFSCSDRALALVRMLETPDVLHRGKTREIPSTKGTASAVP